MAPTRFRNGDKAAIRFDPTLVRRLADGLDETDPLGDAVVAACRDLPRGGVHALNTWLEADSRTPSALHELLEPLAEVPDWVDWRRIDRACVAYWRGGLWTSLALNCAALAAGYRSGAGVKPLTFTGRLVRMAYRRQQETARWILAVTTPGGLRRDAPGFKETIRVRIVHATVRRRILASGRWHAENWGAPINLTDIAYGIAGEFSTIPVAAVRDAGLHYSQAERDDIQHLWRYIGHLLGVPDDLLAVNEEQAHTIIAVKDLTDTPADADSRALVRALIENGTPPELLVPSPFVRLVGKAIPPVLHGLTRHWAGDEVANELEIPDTALKYLVPLLRPAVRATDLVRRLGLRDGARIATRTRARAQTLLDAGHAPAGVVAAAEAGAAVQSNAIRSGAQQRLRL
jgi:hypothetical protein